MTPRIAAAALAGALSLCGPATSAEPPALRVILVGDSTMAPRNGYGDALCQRFTAAVSCLNLGVNGRSSLSYRAEGLWDKMLAQLGSPPGPAATYVLIQFGHNDQPGKPGRSTDLATEYPVNLAAYIDDLRSRGAHPVLVTPLTRRSFKGGTLDNDLLPWADAMRGVAAARKVPLIELNARSAAAVQAMGQEEADTLAEVPPPVGNAPPGKFDRTHLGAKGAQVFARIMARELGAQLPALAAALKPEP